MAISDKGLAIIKQFEGFRADAYQDAVGVWTIGYGSTEHVKPGMSITEEEAESLLRSDAQIAVDCVNHKVGPPLTQNQFDALVSFVFNVGCAAFSSSTLLRYLNAGETQAAANQFLIWCHAGNKILPGLLVRRKAEQALFLS